MKDNKKRVPTYASLVEATFCALKELGGSGKIAKLMPRQ